VNAYATRIAALFIFSGASGLVFEVIWVRQLALWTGHGTVAVSLVVAAFLLGMVLGSVQGGRAADRGGDLLRTYSRLEAFTGMAALLVSLVLSRSAWLSMYIAEHFPPVCSSTTVRVLSGFAMVLAPTAAMGATLPVLARHLTREHNGAGVAIGTLYALNTLGATLGCALAGFVFLGTFGMLRTAFVASACNLLVAVVARTIPSETSPREISDIHSSISPNRTALLALASMTGFAAIACEVLWFRVLHAFVKSSTYAFTLLLVVFLAGLVAGGAMFAKRFAGHAKPWSLLADVQTVQALATLMSMALLGRAGSLGAMMARVVGGAASLDSDLVHMGLGAVIIFLPAAVMGVSFPLVLEIGARDSQHGMGRGIGDLAGANTLGGALGSLLTGLVLIPTIGTQKSFVLCVAISLVAALLARMRMGTWTVRGDDGRTTRLALVIAVVTLVVPSDYLIRAVSAFPRARVLDVREGRDGTAAVLSYDRSVVCAASRNHCVQHCRDDFSYQQLLFGTVSYASTIPPAKRYMRTLAHLPMLLYSGRTKDHPDASVHALQICFGTGTTAGAFVSHSELTSLTIVDINADVFSFARYFEASNQNVLRDRRVHPVIEDGRHYLETHQGIWDVVSLEPPPPTAEGAASLYTREFYAAARRHMHATSVLAQWIPLDQQDDVLNRAMLASMLAEFQHVEVYVTSRHEGVIVASDASLTPVKSQWDQQFAQGSVQRSLEEVGFVRPEDLLATRYTDHEATVRWVGHVAPMVDDLPSVEFYRVHHDGLFRAQPRETSMVEGFDPVRVTERTVFEQRGMRAWTRFAQGDAAGAHSLALEMEALAPGDTYARYLSGLEYNCLNLEEP
jgi:spermidine synthase